MAEFWGWHLLLDIKACDIDTIKNEENLSRFLSTLVERIDMVAYGDPVIKHFATHDPEKAGYSIVQLIETSNITGHFVDKNGDAYIDVFSCKPFQPEEVIAVVKEFFAPERIDHQLVYRLAKS
jgi:S-adenosylmethionine/arginine decarboxylase-like enzyme